LYEVLDVVHAKASFASRVDFTSWHRRIAENASGTPLSYYDMLRLVGQILVDRGDGHSNRLSPGEYARLQTNMEGATLNTTPPSGTVRDGGIGYMRIPAVIASTGSGAFDSYVTPAHQLLQQSACGWILDLRGNTGGSVPPMMAAVAPLLGHGTFLGYIDRLGRTHDGAIAPDVAVATNSSGTDDAAVTAATAWLSQQSACRNQP
jgi:C-terminal processing protease CtpA/Prc